MIARDVVFQGYYGGAGTQWFGYDSRNRRYEKSGGWDQIENKIQAASRTRPSLLAALAFHHESKDQYICDPMSITGNFHKDSILRDLMDDDIPHYASSPYYSAMLGAQLGGTLDDTTNSAAGGMFHTSGSAGICYQGLQCSKDGQGKWEDYTQNTGHLGRCESLDSSLGRKISIFYGFALVSSHFCFIVFIVLQSGAGRLPPSLLSITTRLRILFLFLISLLNNKSFFSIKPRLS